MALDSYHGMAGHGVSGDSYGSYGSSNDGQQYPQHISPYLQPNFPLHQSQWDGDPGSVTADHAPAFSSPSTARPSYRKQGASENDSGVDMTFTDRARESGQGSDWAQTSTSSQTPKQAYASHGTYATTPSTGGGSGSSVPRSTGWKHGGPQSEAGSFPHGSEGARPSFALPHAILGDALSADGPTRPDRNGASWLESKGRGMSRPTVPAEAIVSIAA